MTSKGPPALEARHLPSGTVTFLFTDIADSTPLWEKFPEAMKPALAAHDSILKEAVEAHHGLIVKTTGDGVHAVFTTAIDAINTAVSSQRDLQSLRSPVPLKSRMGIHTGEAELRDGDYFGQTLNRAARIMAAGHGGQVLISDVTAQVSHEHLPADVSLLDLGSHLLKGLLNSEKIHQIVAAELPKEFPPLNSTPTATNNLPAQLTSFVGREREMMEAGKRLENSRLLTLIGPGGTGKTRLSIQLGAEQILDFKDGVWLVELASISDPALIIPTIAATFEIREVQNVPLIQLVIDYLRAREILIVLDNCEHLVEASAQLVDQLLHACASLKIIASSREALGIEGETVYRVPSLKDEEAIQLFVDRATKAEPRFRLTNKNASFVTQICSRLDGIPLAIELAAARVKLFTPQQIAERLDDRFKLLTGGSRTALPRQQTLRALIDWSYQSLNETEQIALRRLAVFSGGWTFEGAESVVGGEVAMDGLLGLVSKSLVNVDELNGTSRYRFLETIRQYAMEKLLESGEAAAMRNRHLDFVLKLSEFAPQRMFGTEEVELLDRIETEHDNLRVALHWAIDNHPHKALILADAVGGFWTVRDHIAEARAWCRAILDRTKTLSEADVERARVYTVLGWISVTTGEHRAGREAAEEAILLAKKTGDAVTLVRAYGIQALTSIFLGDYQLADRVATEAENIARQQNLRTELVFALSARAQMAYFARQNLDQAKAYLFEAASIAREQSFVWASSFLAIGMGHIAAVLGDIETARIGFKESANIAKKVGNKRIVYSSQSEFAHVLRQQGQLEEPLATYRDLLPKWRDLGHRSAVAHELECIAYILIRKEEPDRAAVLLGAAAALRTAIDSVMTLAEKAEYEKEIASLRSGMEADEFEASWNRGRTFTMDEAIEFAIS